MVSGKPFIAYLLVYKRPPLQPSVLVDLSYLSASFHSILFTSTQKLESPLDSLIFLSYLKKDPIHTSPWPHQPSPQFSQRLTH